MNANAKSSALVYLAPKTLPTAEILSGENARPWVSMVLYLKKINEN